MQAVKPNWHNRSLFQGDNLEFMQSMNSESVHLIATDPPFNKGKDFHATPESLSAGASFGDRWRWEEDIQPEWLDEIHDDWPGAWTVIDMARQTYGDDLGAFLCFMAVRLMSMRRVLRNDGSIYLHCDPTASHYLKALMDAIFGPKRFRNELVWCYSGGGIPKRDYPRKHDIILRYSKGNKWTFNVERKAYKSNTQQVGKHSTYSGGKDIDLARGTPVTDWWSDVQTTTGWSPENTGYPTQKPLELYRRIIRASSNPGDIVFDPFAGCATTCVAAEAEGRQRVAADIWEGTLGVTQERLETLARPTGSGETSGLRLYPVVQRTEPLVRTDEGEVSAPPLKSVFRKRTAPTMKREEMLAALIERDGLQCQGCGFVPPHKRHLEIDHKLPRSEGGSNDLDNRVLLCGPCNRAKSNTLTLTGLRKQNERDGLMVSGGP